MRFVAKKPKIKQPAWLDQPTPDHRVQFYSSKRGLISPLYKYIKEGLSAGDTCVVIAKTEHLDVLHKRLSHDKIISTNLITMNATDTLNKIMLNGLPDRDRFFDVIGGLVEQEAAKGHPIRAYGEMVALLWASGNRTAVMKLEKLWNELADRYQFSLYCAYPELHFITYKEVLEEIKGHHHQHAPA